jgi:hypothetical protein
MNPPPIEFYQSKKLDFQVKLKSVSKKVRLFAWYRLATFLLIFVPLVIWGWNSWLTIILSLLFAILFFFLVKKNIHFEKRRKKYEVLIKILEDELLALEHQFSHFESGKEFLDPAHFNSYDLDLFGEGSVFQFLNRTSTSGGKQKLAEWLQNPFYQKEEIELRQEAIREVAAIPKWRLHFMANSHLFSESRELASEIISWSRTTLEFKRPASIRRLLYIIPTLTLFAGAVALLGGSEIWIILMVLFQWSLLWSFRKKISFYYSFFGRKSELLGKYMQLLEFIETREFHAPFLIGMQKKVNKPYRASHIFRQLQKRVNQFEYRQNIVINILFNSLFLWDVRCVYNLWKWHRKNHSKLTLWLDVISETDALISLANLVYNNPQFNFPEIHEGGFTLNAKQIGHPLIPDKKRVDNDLSINGWGKVMIVTGANMAGKSTFLRTVGVNLILGSTGAPVCAEELVFTPIKIYTNMRTTDSLLKDESYFFAELKRIKIVLNRLETGERIFVILDEMLKGTNSVDKLNGSKALIKKLLELKTVALIATHDLKISEMENEYPQMVFNKCFEIKLENDEMMFDYLLTDGVTKTMNATFLMKKMGII